MTKITKSINYGSSLKKMVTPEYGMKHIALTNSLVLTKNGEPIHVIPEELSEDFSYILSRCSAYDNVIAPEETSEAPTLLLYTQP